MKGSRPGRTKRRGLEIGRVPEPDAAGREHTQQALRESEERYRDVFEASPLPMWVWDDETLDFVAVNQAAVDLYGYSRDEFQRMNVRDIWGSGEGTRYEDTLRNRAREQSLRLERTHRTKDGRIIEVEVSARRFMRSGRPVWLTVVNDVSERNRAEAAMRESEERFRATFDSAPLGIMHTAIHDDTILHVNPQLCALVGYTPDELLGMKTDDILHPGHRGTDRGKYREKMLKGEMSSFSSERILMRKDGSDLWVNRTVSLARDAAGKPLYFIRIIEDINERKQGEVRRQMEHSVTRALEQSADIAGAMSVILRTVCEGLGWTCGIHWKWDEKAELLRCAEAWHAQAEEVAMFVAATRQSVNEAPAWHGTPPKTKTGGIVREVWSSGAPVWFPDVTGHPDFRRGPAAAQAGLHCAFAFPVLAGDQPLGVMEFFSRDIKQPDEPLLQMVRAIGSQIGQFIQRNQAEEALRMSEGNLRATFDQASVGIHITSVDGRFLQTNDKYCDILGYAREELLKLHLVDVNYPGHKDDAARLRKRVIAGEINAFSLEKPLMRKDGSPVWTTITASAVRGPDRSVQHFVSVVQDISERKRAEAALRESEEQFKQLASNIPQVFWIADAEQKRTLYVSPAAQTLLGRSPQELVASPRTLLRLVQKEDRARIHAARKTAADGGYDLTYRVVRPDGSMRWVQERAFPVQDESGKVYRIAGITEDVTERQLAEERLMQLAHYDVLTSLPNRVLFYDRLRQVLAQARRNQWTVGVMFIDVDRFKNVNDTLGHAVGDKLLQQVSERLMRSVRSGDTVGRLGGDEFAIVLADLASAQDASLVAQKIMASFSEPFALEGADIYVTASIGITLYPDHSIEQDTLIKNADAAMYRAKEMGRNGYQLYAPEMNTRSLEILSMESSLRRALDRGEFGLFYQPKVSIADGNIVGVEALLRWHHPERGLVTPGEFMSVLEETGLIVPVGVWVLKSVCSQIVAWESTGIAPPPVAVNLSARQFNAPDFGPTIRRILEEQRVDPGLIEFEITESSIMANTEDAARTLEYLSTLGAGLAIDDFGTGYSSLSYLKRFPIDALKIDRSFIRDLTTDRDDATITRAVISMAHSLGLKVIAEGVETEAQLAFLAEYGCDEIQGYYFSRPLEVAECGDWLREKRGLQRPSSYADGSAPVVLLVDDDDEVLVSIKGVLAHDGYRILTAHNAREGFALIRDHPVDVVISDHHMPGMKGVEFLECVKTLSPRTIRMLTTSYADFHTMADAVNKGEIFRFLPKEVAEDRLRADVREALRARLDAVAGDGHAAAARAAGK